MAQWVRHLTWFQSLKPERASDLHMSTVTPVCTCKHMYVCVWWGQTEDSSESPAAFCMPRAERKTPCRNSPSSYPAIIPYCTLSRAKSWIQGAFWTETTASPSPCQLLCFPKCTHRSCKYCSQLCLVWWWTHAQIEQKWFGQSYNPVRVDLLKDHG